jgi:hypothetical protein
VLNHAAAIKPPKVVVSFFNYTIIGAILEKVSGIFFSIPFSFAFILIALIGSPWEVLIKKELFVPLGMKTAGYALNHSPSSIPNQLSS